MDHCLDLAPFLFALRAKELARTEPLLVLGPVGMKNYFRNIRRTWEHRVDASGFDLSVEEWNGKGFTWRGIVVDAAWTSHSVPNLAWRIDAGDGSGCGLIITGDGRSTDELVKLGRSGDHVMVAESAAGPGEDMEGHMNPAQAGQLASACRSSKLVLTHVGPRVSTESILRDASAQYGGEIIVAVDGMEMKIC
jgi:ribonuclease BN (tRNA processing enzyme)